MDQEEEESAPHLVELDFIDGSESEEENTGENAPVAEPAPRRSVRERRPIDFYGVERTHLTIHSEPATIEEATSCPEKVTIRSTALTMMRHSVQL